MAPDHKALQPDFIASLKKSISGDIRTDLTARLLYSTDASIYQVEPLGVVFPRTLDDLNAIMEVCARFLVPLLPRGAGSSLAGQAIGPSLIVDCSRYLNHFAEIDPQSCTAVVEPGLVLAALNRAAGKYGLQFGPDPASAERATLGGSLANNASGAHSIVYGMAADHLLSAEVILSDGSIATWDEVTLDDVRRKAIAGGTVDANLYSTALSIRQNFAQVIRSQWPRTWRRASGYSLNYLLPWSPSEPPMWSETIGCNLETVAYPPISDGSLNLAPLLAGSEGTLAIIRRARVRLVPLPTHTVLGVLAFPDIPDACDAVPNILECGPSAVELVPPALIRLARSVPAYASQLGFLDQFCKSDGEPPCLLLVEFAGEYVRDLIKKVLGLRSISGITAEPLMAETPVAQRQVWGVRKAGLGILMSRFGDDKPWSFIEDLAVPVQRLGEFVREMNHILADHNTYGEIYAHASAGCLHIRPILNLKTDQGVRHLRSIAEQAVELTLSINGSVSGEHGDGLARSEWIKRMFGNEIVEAFRQLKRAADPHNLLNPGKIVSLSDSQSLPAMHQNLRFGTEYRARFWQPVLDFSQQAGLDGAIEQCNGAGVCRKAEGVMCPSFQATQDEMHSTRGRANLLRAMISGRFPTQEMAEQVVYEALDLCLACKGCMAECPSAVDMAKIKYEFVNHYYTHHIRNLRDYLFAYIGEIAKVGYHFSGWVNPILRHSTVSRVNEQFFGLAHQRSFPPFSKRSFRQQFQKIRNLQPEARERVLFLSDAFTEYFYPEIGMKGVQVLQEAGCRVEILPVVGAGRTLISKGFIDSARRHAKRLVEKAVELDPRGEASIVGVEPSEIYTLSDEYFDLLPGDVRIQSLASRAYSIEEYLIRPAGGEADPERLSIARLFRIAIDTQAKKPQVLLHGHCHQKARPPAADGFAVGMEASISMLKMLGYEVEMIEAGCCGMAGAFGYEAEHYNLSLRIGELALFPAIRKADPNSIVVASGYSCRSQIQDGTQRTSVHPVMLI